MPWLPPCPLRSLPTPPRTREREQRRTSHSPGSAEQSATKRRATSSPRPFNLPADHALDGGLYPAPTIEPSSSSFGDADASSWRADAATNAILALSPPLTGTRSKKRHPAHRQVDALGPTRRAALTGGFVSVDWKAPPPPAFVADALADVALPPLPSAAAAGARQPSAARKDKPRRNRDPAKGPVWDDGNPFLAGIGLKDQGLVAGEQRVGSLEEKETIGYVLCVVALARNVPLARSLAPDTFPTLPLASLAAAPRRFSPTPSTPARATPTSSRRRRGPARSST